MTSSASGWNMRLRKPENEPFIGKFISRVDFEKSVKPVRMYLQAEDIKEEAEIENEIKDAEYYKRKKREHRRWYNKLSRLLLEDSSSSSNSQFGKFEGSLVDLSLELDNSSTLAGQSSTSDNNLFRYALLEVVADSENNKEVNVIPIHNMFMFRKPTLAQDKFLDEIDDDYDKKLENDKRKLNRYRRIGKALEDAESRDEPLSAVERVTYDTTLPAGSGFEIPSLFGKLAKKSGSKKTGRNTSSGLVDEDQIKELNEEFVGDYTAKFVDDEEDHVELEQKLISNVEDRFAAGRDTIDVNGVEDNDEEDYEDDDDDEIPILPGEQVVQPPTHFAGIEMSVFDESMRSASDLLKRKFEKSVDSQQDKSQIKSVDATTLEPPMKKMAIEPPKSLSSDKYDFSRAGVQAYLESIGGRVTTSALKEAFKSQLKTESKRLGDKKLAQEKFLEYVLSVATTDSTAAEPTLVLKQLT